MQKKRPLLLLPKRPKEKRKKKKPLVGLLAKRSAKKPSKLSFCGNNARMRLKPADLLVVPKETCTCSSLFVLGLCAIPFSPSFGVFDISDGRVQQVLSVTTWTDYFLLLSLRLVRLKDDALFTPDMILRSPKYGCFGVFMPFVSTTPVRCLFNSQWRERGLVQ